ncbi:hypothetical protein SDRG_07088 [Saprolegnia diclina VS20]|uniref:Brix domain-containing protein n=1 Tax=Saprolegnia diclina (strain VS20) TaxID=1156394 RepID=T0QKY4_SAPDV|nr:hypothetical protein SDRG_07088 [Saprolegnia diclina VS20]EQC35376.1 hypothetical protein SDRG_07088 [Saprolegnia diclina VS20]|eukprot:XP_008611126.1 hypothetical protein SDRG_07088 [Saprolegnia diclina VS20]
MGKDAKQRSGGKPRAGDGGKGRGKSMKAAAAPEEDAPKILRKNPSGIKNKIKRQQVMQLYKKEKKTMKKEAQAARKKEAEELGDKAPAKQEPRTIDNAREAEVTMIGGDDDEIAADDHDDEFARIFGNEETPKLMITTRPFPSGDMYPFVQNLMEFIPNSFYYDRKTYDIKDICRFAGNKAFTHVCILSEKEKKVNGMVVSRLPHGPTAFFKISNVVLNKQIQNKAKRTSHQPELILNNFNTRLGHRIGRFLGSFFEHKPDFKGRQVVTFHNQRDFIFVRQHRYIFENGKKARLQEIGPRFTMKLRWLQEGTFDTKYGEYEWIHKQHAMDTSRRKFHL